VVVFAGRGFIDWVSCFVCLDLCNKREGGCIAGFCLLSFLLSALFSYIAKAW
jgi:hypothetical protein